jgi:Uma2 family endonuclease
VTLQRQNARGVRQCYASPVAQRTDDLVFESTRTVTQAEFAVFVRAHEAWDPHRYELLSGRVLMNPPAGYPHGEIEANVVSLLGQFVRTHHLGKVFGSSQGYELPTGDTLEPDASFVSNARWKAGPLPKRGEFLRVVPDLVVEISSPSTASRDRGEKRKAYEAAGVRELWLIDERAGEVHVFVRKGRALGRERVASGGKRVKSVVLSGLVIDAGELIPKA